MADDENLELKKRSRRRLVGAAALALLAAVVLPMVMDDEPGVPVQDIQVTIPDRNADSALAKPIGGRPEADVVVAPPPQEQPPVPTASRSPDESRPSSANLPQADKGATADKGDAVPARPNAAPAIAPSSGQDEAARVQALLDGKTTAAQGQSYVIQVGAFSEKAKAAAMSGDLKGRGFSSYTEDAGAVTRVRVGPYASREDAEKAAVKLGVLGIDGVITSR